MSQLAPPAIATVATDRRIVADGKIRHLAVTKIQRFNPDEEGCPLRWYYAEVQGRREPERTWHEEGDKIDKQVTWYLTTNENVLGQYARPLKDYLPEPGKDLLLQWGLNDKPRAYDAQKARYKSYFPPEEAKLFAAGIPLIGFCDVLNGREKYLVPIDRQNRYSEDSETCYGDRVAWRDEPRTVEVLDVKSSKNFTYAKRHLELKKNTQMMGYGKFVLSAQTPDAEYVRLSHATCTTEGIEKAIKRSVLVTRAEIDAYWNYVDGVAEKMKSVAGERDEKCVKGNLNVCNSFGGCPHRDYCHTYKGTNSLKRFTMGLLKGRSTPTPPNGAAVAAPPPTNGATPWVPPAAPPVIAQPPTTAIAPAQTMAPPPPPPPQQQYAPPPAPAAAPPPPPPPAPVAAPPPPPPPAEPPPGEWVLASAAIQGRSYILPPQNYLGMYLAMTGGRQSFLPIVNGEPGGEPIFKELNDQIYQLPAKPKAAPVPPPAPAQAAPPPPAPTAPAGAQTAPPPAAAPPAKKPRTPRAAAATAAATPTASGIELFVNAVPSRPYTDLQGYVTEVLKDMEAQFQVTDVRAVMDDKSPLAFGRWKGILASCVKEAPPAAGTYVAFTRGDELTEVVVAALAPLAGPGFVRGV